MFVYSDGNRILVRTPLKIFIYCHHVTDSIVMSFIIIVAYRISPTFAFVHVVYDRFDD